MVRIVKLRKDMRPHRRGDDVVVPDSLAKSLIASGEAEDSRPYPPPDVKPAVPVGATRPMAPASRGPKKGLFNGKHFLTRSNGS